MIKMNSLNKNLAIFVLFAILTGVFTYPLFFRATTSIPGFESTDEPYWSLWVLSWLKYSLFNKFDTQFTPFLAAPFGLDLGKVLYPVWDFACRYLSVIFGVLLAYNLQIIFSLFLSAVFMYLLVKRLTASRLAGLFSGVIYSFCPYHMVRIWQHFNLIQIEWLALCLLALCNLREKNSLRNSVFMGLIFSMVAVFNYYYAYFALILTLSFCLFVIIYDKNSRFGTIKYIFAGMAFMLMIVTPMILPTFKGLISSSGVGDWSYLRPFDHLFVQSAKPLSYFLPATTHPVFGRFTENFIGTPLYGLSLTEHTLYLGWIPLLLSFIAFRNWRKKTRPPAIGYPLSADEGFYIGFFVFLAIVAWFFSQPPWWQIGPLKIYMPSFFMYKLLPMFRAYARFGVVVMLAVSVLAGFGLKFILDRFKSRKSKICLTFFFCGLVLFEFWNWPPYKVIEVSKAPAVYYWLKGQAGDFTIAEYPLDAVAPDQRYRFYQMTHGKKIINSTMPGTIANDLAKTITKLSDPKTAGVLRWMGVKYAVIHRDRYLNTGLLKDKDEFDKVPLNKGLKFVRTFPTEECQQKDIMCIQKTGPIDVYEVMAAPVKPGLIEK